jgi:hypothetical protein
MISATIQQSCSMVVGRCILSFTAAVRFPCGSSFDLRLIFRFFSSLALSNVVFVKVGLQMLTSCKTYPYVYFSSFQLYFSNWKDSSAHLIFWQSHCTHARFVTASHCSSTHTDTGRRNPRTSPAARVPRPRISTMAKGPLRGARHRRPRRGHDGRPGAGRSGPLQVSQPGTIDGVAD